MVTVSGTIFVCDLLDCGAVILRIGLNVDDGGWRRILVHTRIQKCCLSTWTLARLSADLSVDARALHCADPITAPIGSDSR